MKPNCRRICDLLARYADGELSDLEYAEVQRHLEACRPCRGIAGFECGGRALLRARAGHLRAQPVPPGLESRCRALAAARRRASSVWMRRAAPVVAAAAVIALLGGLVAFVTRRSDALLAAQLTADHVKCFGLFRPAGGASMDAGQAGAMLASRFGLDVHVPPSSGPAAVALVGARRCLYADGSVPHLMYQVGGQDVSLFVLEGQTRPPADLTMFGHRARIWSRGGNTFVLVSPEAERAAGGVEYVRQEAR